MSKYIRLAIRPACAQRLLHRAFWFTVWLSISPVAISSPAPGPENENAAPAITVQPAPDGVLSESVAERGMPGTKNRIAPPSMKIPVIILWDETGKPGVPGTGPARARASITTCKLG